jgi:hypothetical protein
MGLDRPVAVNNTLANQLVFAFRGSWHLRQTPKACHVEEGAV